MVTFLPGEFAIDIIEPHLLQLPNVFDDEAPVTFAAALMRLRAGRTTLCEWQEDDVDTALDDLDNQVHLNLGDVHLDRFPAAGGWHLQAQSASAAEPAPVVEVSDDDYMTAVAVARRQHHRWLTGQGVSISN